VELVHKLLQPSLGNDGDDDGLFEKGILEKRVPEKFNFMQLIELINLKGRVAMKLPNIGLHDFLSYKL